MKELSSKDDPKANILVENNLLISTITANCFNRLNLAGFPTYFQSELAEGVLCAYKVFLMPIIVSVEKGDELKWDFWYNGVQVSPKKGGGWFKKAGRIWKCDYKPMMLLNYRDICHNGADTMIEKSKSIFIHLNNLWERFGYSLKKLNLQFGLTLDGDIVLVGLVDENFWNLETLQKKIFVKRVGKDTVHVCPEWMPKLAGNQKEKLEKLISELKNGKQKVFTARSPGWHKEVTITKCIISLVGSKYECFFVFPSDINPMIFGNSQLVKDKIDSLHKKERGLVILEKYNSSGNIVVEKDDQGKISLFMGHIPDFVDSQKEQLRDIKESLEMSKSQKMIVGEKFDTYIKHEILILNHEHRIALIPHHFFQKLAEEEKARLLEMVKNTQRTKAMVTPPNVTPLTDLGQIADYSEEFYPNSPDSKRR